jgi:hypothetical protein
VTEAAPPAVRDFSLLLPPGWARIPLDDRVPLRIKNLVAERLSNAPPEQREGLRSSLTRELTETLASAARQGGLDVLLSLDPVAGQPVPASCLVTHLQGRSEGDVLESLLATLTTGGEELDVRELDVVEVADAPAVRRLSARHERVAPAGALPGGTLHVTQLEYFVPIPGQDGLLLLAFSTPIEQLGPPLVKLFDVMATGLRWVTS